MDSKKAEEEFLELLLVSDILMGPNGCPWDREQTLVSMRSSILEEACEVIEAVDEKNNQNLVEELGDLLYNVIFFCQLGEKENRFTLAEVIRTIREKLIQRHPHVFKDKKVKDSAEVLDQWERIKQEEKKERESLMDGIPKGLPALSRAYKIAGKLQKKGKGIDLPEMEFETEDELSQLLWIVCQVSRKKGIHPEHALRKRLLEEELDFRAQEKKIIN